MSANPDKASDYELLFQMDVLRMESEGKLEVDPRMILPLYMGQGSKEQIQITISRKGAKVGDVKRFEDDSVEVAEYTKRTAQFSDYYIGEKMHAFINDATRMEQQTDMVARFVKKDVHTLLKRYLTGLMGPAYINVEAPFPKDGTIKPVVPYEIASKEDDGWVDHYQPVGAGGAANPDTVMSLFNKDNQDLDIYENMFYAMSGAVTVSAQPNFTPGAGNVALCDACWFAPYKKAYIRLNSYSNKARDAAVYDPMLATGMGKGPMTSWDVGERTWTWVTYSDRTQDQKYSSMIDFIKADPTSGVTGHSVFPICVAGIANSWYIGYYQRKPFGVQPLNAMQQHTDVGFMHGSTCAIRNKSNGQAAFWGRIKNATLLNTNNIMSMDTPNMDPDSKQGLYIDTKDGYGANFKDKLRADLKDAKIRIEEQHRLEDMAGRSFDPNGGAVEAAMEKRRKSS